jgi:outer membrane protein TolC
MKAAFARLVLGAALFATSFASEGPVQPMGAGINSPCGDAERPRLIELADVVGLSLRFQPQLIIARQDTVESRSDARAASAPFLPSVQLAVIDEQYAPSNGGGPVVVVGNTVLGGTQTKSAYGSISLSWNLMNSGRDLAAYRGAQAEVRAAFFGLDSQLADTLTGVLQAYADLYEAELAARNQADAVGVLKAIQARAAERYQNGHGTAISIGQARVAALDAEQSLNRACRKVSERSAALAQSAGIRVSAQQMLFAQEPVPMPIVDPGTRAPLDAVVESTPAVMAAKEKVVQAEAKLHQTQRAFGPSLSLSVRRDYLGQDADSFAAANHHIAPNDYRVGLSFEQPLFPLVSEAAAVSKARAEFRKAQASYEQSRLDAGTRFWNALSAQREAEASYAAAKASYAESQRVLTLTESLYRAGRTDLDNVQHAQMDKDKADTDVRTLESRRAFAQWAAARSLRPGEFAQMIFQQLHLEPEAQRWRDGSMELSTTEAVNSSRRSPVSAP